jgi:hypothetical protein
MDYHHLSNITIFIFKKTLIHMCIKFEGAPSILYVPMEIFLFYEMRKKRENKKRVVYIGGGSFTCMFPLGSQKASCSGPRLAPPLGEYTRMGISPTT